MGETCAVTSIAAPAEAPVVRASAPRSPGGLLARSAGALASGLLLDIAFPPHELWWLAPLPVAVLTLLCRGGSGRRGALLGLVAGLGFFVPLLVWTGTIAGALAWLALALLEAAFFAPLGAALAVVTRLPGWPVWSASLWVAEEALRDRLPFGGFPWGRLAFSQGDTWLTPLAAVGGAPLVTFAVAAIGSALAAAAGRVELRVALALAAVVLVAAPLVPTPTGGRQVTVAVVQGNVPRLGLEAFTQRAAVLGNHAAATHELAAAVRAGSTPRPDLVIWPENASDLDPYTDPQAASIIDAAVKDVGVPVLVGAVIDGPGDKIRNTGIVWDPTTGPGAMYVKRHPVPFGEYMPFRSFARRISSKVDLVPRDFARGSKPGVLDVGPARLADVICFEVAYDGVVRKAVRGGGRLLVVQTNNATFGHSGETHQQLAMGRLRAVEHGRTVLVAATSGVSAVIAPDGRLVDRSQVFARDVIVQRVPLRSATTLATRLGVLPELVLCGIAALALLTALVRR
ncbi:MAG: apolipoprotein N-acyltransferase [Actinomycetota bacterium]|jgi:apolipoprotein N-acyltransferase|nr:apolipoprotein N-acyltransferase [Actinomycetota bacterium]